MSLPLFLYLANMLDSLEVILFTFLFMGAFALIIGIIAYATEELPEFVNLIKKYLWLYGLSVLMFILIPSEKTMYLMAGASYFQKSDTPPKIEAVIQKKLDEYLVPEVKK